MNSIPLIADYVNPKIELKGTNDAGLALFAKEKINKNELLVCEKPLLSFKKDKVELYSGGTVEFPIEFKTLVEHSEKSPIIKMKILSFPRLDGKNSGDSL